MKISRRDFLKGSAAAGIMSTLPLTALAEEAPMMMEESDKTWGEAPKPVESFDFAETIECDVVVVGAGTAGMPAAISAAQNGLDVVVLEKSGTGFGMRSYLGAVGSKAQMDAGVEIDEKDIVQELLRYSSYRANANLIRLWAERSGEAMDWLCEMLADKGFKVWVEADVNEGLLFKEYPTCHMFWNPDNADATHSEAMRTIMEEAGCHVHYETAMIQLIQEDGKVTGVVAQDADENYIRVNAGKGVVLATGGYAGNEDMMHALNEKDWKSNVMVYCDPFATGDGIRAAHFAGGQMDLAHTAMYFQRGCTLPGVNGGEMVAPMLWWMGSQPFLSVNKKGVRYGNEALPYDYDLHQAAGQPGHVMIQIFDSNWKEDVLAFHTIGCSRIVTQEMKATDYPTCSWTFESIEAATINPTLAQGQLVQADTIEELAEKMGIDPETLSATVARYNELCELGEDLDFYKESFRMRPVAQAPFYAVTVGGQLLCSMDGMQINDKFQVLDENHDPIEGLYAIGNDSGCYFADCYPELIVGAAAGRSLTWGYLLGKELAE